MEFAVEAQKLIGISLEGSRRLNGASSRTLPPLTLIVYRIGAELARSAMAGCFAWLRVVSFLGIWEWISETPKEEERLTAMCPKCGIDAVIGDASGYPVADAEFLERMRRHWFNF